jgi:hypothetical protein
MNPQITKLAELCVHFALFAVRFLFYRKGRGERAKGRKGIQGHCGKLHQYPITPFLALIESVKSA